MVQNHLVMKPKREKINYLTVTLHVNLMINFIIRKITNKTKLHFSNIKVQHRISNCFLILIYCQYSKFRKITGFSHFFYITITFDICLNCRLSHTSKNSNSGDKLKGIPKYRTRSWVILIEGGRHQANFGEILQTHNQRDAKLLQEMIHQH